MAPTKRRVGLAQARSDRSCETSGPCRPTKNPGQRPRGPASRRIDRRGGRRIASPSAGQDHKEGG
eukprot:4071033-Alexandrium_andersonii.AAC.1